LQGRNVLLYEDNTTVVASLAKLTTRSNAMMAELRHFMYLLDNNDIKIRLRYTRPSANIWADTLRRDMDIDNRQLNPLIFSKVQRLWGPHYVDHFASMLNTQLPRFNARWRDPHCEDIDCMHLLYRAWLRDDNYRNTP
jgi:hypothetical protein